MRTTAALTRDELEQVIAAATRAPSVLNTQPWRFRAHDDVIDVLADESRGLAHLDPNARELLISCGAALMNLRLAVAALGREPVVRLLPHTGDPRLLASVRVAGSRRPTHEEARLSEAIPRRRTSREPFEPRPIAATVLHDLRVAATAEGARLELSEGWQRQALADFVHAADIEQRHDPGLVAEVEAWTRGRTEAGSGIPTESLGPRADDSHALVRDFAMGRNVEGRAAARFEDGALLAVLLTDHDAPADRLRAGQALERVLLAATAEGVSTSLLTQPVENPDLRRLVRDPRSGFGWPQAVLRLGYGPEPPATSRRPVADVLDATGWGG